MTFLVVVSAQEGLVTMRLASPEAVGESVRDNLEQPEAIACAVQSWAAGAKPGDFLDGPFGWVFCVDGETTEITKHQDVAVLGKRVLA